MNFKTKLKSPGFWTGLGGAVIIALQACGVEIKGETSDILINVICSVLVLLGIFKDNGAVKQAADKVTDAARQIEDLSALDENKK
jgi:uncharacterized membrane protein